LAHQFSDGFDEYNSAAIAYSTVSGSITYSSSYARFAPPAGFPGQGVKVGNGAYAYYNLSSSQSTLIIRIAFYVAALSGRASFLSLANSGTDRCNFFVQSSGAIGVRSGLGSGTTLATTTPGLLTAGQWYGLEVEVAISTTVGAVTAWLNGVQILTASGLDFLDTIVNQVGFGDLNTGGIGWYFDDFRVWDNTGSTQNAPTGTDGRIITKLASGPGAFAQMTPNGAAANWQCTDENPPNAGTTYVSGATSGLVDSYAMPAAAFSAAPVMVVARSYVSKNDGGARSIEIGVDSAGTQGYGSTFVVGSSYAYIESCIALDPHTGAAWTAAGADAAQHCKQQTA